MLISYDLCKDNELIGGMDAFGLYCVEADFSSGYSDLNGLGASGVKAMVQKA